MMNRRYRASLLMSLSLVVGVLSSAAAQQNPTDFRTVVDSTVIGEMKRQGVVGAAVGLLDKSRVIYTKGYGFADLEQQIPFTDETIINWASNSKPVIAVLAMQLVQNDKLDLDKTINHYISDLPGHLHSITPRHLLCHQSGIPHYSNGKVVPSGNIAETGNELDPANALNRFINSPLIFQPGEKQDYSSYAYVLLTAVVQAAGEEPIANQLSSRITDPLGLHSFQLDVPWDGHENWSNAYCIVDGEPVEVSEEANFWKHGAGAYKSNVKDFATFANSLIGTRLINSKTTTQMVTQQNTADGTATGLGLGIYVTGSGNNLKVSHNGAQNETRTRMVIYPNQGHGIVVMCNSQNAEPGRITTAIYNALSKLRARN